ncbi:hypothetical protein D9M71_668690 [compost metagenome]
MRRINLDTEAGETGGQFDGNGGQLILVLGHVLAVDHQQRFLTGKGVGADGVAGLEASWCGGQPALVGRNGAIGIAGFLGAHGGQGAT